MYKWLLGVIGISVLLWHGAPDAHGQKAVELFIPIGQSPGLSGTVTVIGTLEAVDRQHRAITISAPGGNGTWTAEITDRTRIWLDRTKLRQTNRPGSFDDLEEGRRVEVKYLDDMQRGTGPAEWIKVEATGQTSSRTRGRALESPA